MIVIRRINIYCSLRKIYGSDILRVGAENFPGAFLAGEREELGKEGLVEEDGGACDVVVGGGDDVFAGGGLQLHHFLQERSSDVGLVTEEQEGTANVGGYTK